MTATVKRSQARSQPVFLAPYLWEYMRRRSWSWHELAGFLGVTSKGLWELSLCRRPASAAALDELCRRWGVLPERLAEVLGTLHRDGK